MRQCGVQRVCSASSAAFAHILFNTGFPVGTEGLGGAEAGNNYSINGTRMEHQGIVPYAGSQS